MNVYPARLGASVLLCTLLHTRAAVLYVDSNSSNPTPPFSGWSTAATTIQDAVDAANTGDQILVTNGVYQTGGKVAFGPETNRVAVMHPVTVQSVNGPQVTVIQGYQVPLVTNDWAAVRCVYLTNGASLHGFTLTNGATLSFSDLEPPYDWMSGGGVWCESGAVASNCVFTGNAAYIGGAAHGGTLYNCLISGNRADYGGGIDSSTAINCALPGNTAGSLAGGAWNSTLTNCTLTGNSAPTAGGGDSCEFDNCIVYFNHAPDQPNFSSSVLNFSCTTPLPDNGTNNTASDPQMADPYHVSPGSPCLGAGNPAFVTGVDIDREPWADPPAIGCDEFHAGSSTGPLSVFVQADYTNVAAGYAIGLSSAVLGHANSNRWSYGDGTFDANRLYASHAWAGAGDYTVVFTAYNDTSPGGVSASLTVHVLAQPVQYVAQGSTNPAPPYLSWATAATNIQDAVDLGFVGGAILVGDGVYQSGGRAAPGALSNRVAVTKAMAVRSVNGPAVTLIVGAKVSGSLIGDGAVRCVFLTNGASLTGFTLTNGATLAIGNYYIPAEQSGAGVFCAWAGVVVSNCVMVNSTCALSGGGAYGGTLNNCILTGNTAPTGGGAEAAILNRCALGTNSASGGGGGADSSTLSSCTLSGNLAGGGGGAETSTLNNCALVANSAAGGGGGAESSTLVNCTLTSNSAAQGGGVNGGSVTNSIVYYNFAPNGSNYSGATFENSCTAPLPATGFTNTSVEPGLADSFHLFAGSACRGAGNPAFLTGVDVDGEAWLNPPSMGCDEFYSGSITGLLSVAAQALYTNVATGLAVGVSSTIAGHATANRWDFGDGTIISNRQYTAHGWTAAGDYPVTFTAYNESNPGGVSASVTVHVLVSPVCYVAQDNSTPAAPYVSWATAATNIQDAIDTAFAGGTVVVSNGVYAAGGWVVTGADTNQVAATKPLSLLSVNGPAATVIDGLHQMRCVYLVDGCSLTGFTLTNGAAAGDGGGLWCQSTSVAGSNCLIRNCSAGGNGGGASSGTLDHCTLLGNNAGGGGGASGANLNQCTVMGNAAWFGGGIGGGTANRCVISTNVAYNSGGGAIGSTLNNCVLAGNTMNLLSSYYGGGANSCTVNNCTIVGNVAHRGGGTAFCTVQNSILFYNANYVFDYEKNDLLSHINYSCIEPYTEYPGTGNFASPPLFVNLAAGDLHLQTNSPCINAGNNSYVVTTTDFDGNRRIAAGAVDAGAFEYLPPDVTAFVRWLQQYGLPTDGTADYTDADNDGMNNWQEWVAGTDPTDAASALRMLQVSSGSLGLGVSWQSVSGRRYSVQRSSDLGVQPAFSLLQSNIAGLAGVTSFTDITATNGGLYFYRVGVQP